MKTFKKFEDARQYMDKNTDARERECRVNQTKMTRHYIDDEVDRPPYYRFILGSQNLEKQTPGWPWNDLHC